MTPSDKSFHIWFQIPRPRIKAQRVQDETKNKTLWLKTKDQDFAFQDQDWDQDMKTQSRDVLTWVSRTTSLDTKGRKSQQTDTKDKLLWKHNISRSAAKTATSSTLLNQNLPEHVLGVVS